MDESSRSLIVKRKKSKNQSGAQAFFSRNLNFFLQDDECRQILGFGAVCRLVDSVVLGSFGEVQKAI